MTIGSLGTTDRTPSRSRRLAQQLASPLRSFIATEAGSAGLLLAATVAALVWVNSPFSSSYYDLWTTELSIRLGDHAITEDLQHWVNDGLMVFFFFVVGLELRREMAVGELTDKVRLRIPALAACAGILVPALIYLALNPSGDAAQGWGVAISTDTAFALGVLALVGQGAPTQLRVFLLTLAIVDDIAALTIIAFFYSDDVKVLPLLLAAGCVVVILALGRLRVWRGPAYFLVGAVLWAAMLESGVHPAIAGVLIAVAIAVYPPRREEVEQAAALTKAFRQSPVPELARSAKLSVERAVSPNERLQELLHPWTSFVVVPLFALANAGVTINGTTLHDAWTSTVGLGVILGLVVGKLIGVGATSLTAARAGLGRLPRGVGPAEVLGGAALTGIGFTVSLFIVDLAFRSPELRDEAKIGVLSGSTIAALLGWGVFQVIAARARSQGRVLGAPVLDPPGRPGARSHPGPGGRAPDTGGVLRLRVPLLRARHQPGPGAAAALRRRPALRRAQPAAHRRPPEGRARRRGGRGGRRSGPLLGDARPALRPPGRPRAGRPRGARRGHRARRGALLARARRGGLRTAGRATTWRRPRRAASPGRRPSSSAAACTTAPTTRRPWVRV